MKKSQRVQPVTLSQSLQPVSEGSEDVMRNESPQQSTLRLSPAAREKSSESGSEKLLAEGGESQGGQVNAKDAMSPNHFIEPRSPPLDAYKTVPISFKNKPKVPLGAILPPISPSTPPSTKQHNRRRSSLYSEDPLMMSAASRKQEVLDAVDFAIFGSFGSDRARSTLTSKPTEGMKASESNLTAGEDAATTHDTRPSSLYSPGRVEDSSRARSLLLCTGRILEGRQVIVEMATSVPLEYPALDLSEKGLEDGDLLQIGRLLDVYPFAVSLDLFGNRLQFSSPDHQASHKPHPSLTSLSLSRNPFGPLSPHTSLTRFLSSFPALLSLELADCQLNDDDLLRIGVDILGMAKLKRLTLSGNPITAASQPTIVRILTGNTSIEIIDLRNTGIRMCKGLMEVNHKLILDEGKRCCRDCVIQ